MKLMMKSFFVVVSTICFLTLLMNTVYSQQTNSYEQLSQNFENPPLKAQPIVYHWWLGGYVDTVRLKEEIISFKNAGISGFTIFEIGSRDTMIKGGPAFLEKESLETIKFAIDEAGKLGMEVGLNTASSWNAGGSWITPEHAAKSIYFSKAKVKGGIQHNIKLTFPEIPENDPRGRKRLITYGKDGKPVFYQEVAVLAVPVDISKNRLDTAQIIDVSAFFNPKTETLNWTAPVGEWEIQRFVCSNSGENLVLPSPHSAGPIVDHYDADATEFHFNYIIDRLKSVLGDFENTALKSLYMASYEAKGFTWTTTLPAEFKKVNGYEIQKFLPALFADSIFDHRLQANFEADFQRTLSELMINNFYKKSKEICNKHGLKNNCESGGPGWPLHNVPVEPLKALGSLDIPRGEFWINHPYRDHPQGIDILRVVKEVSSASLIYNRDLVEMEAFTTTQHWQEGPFEMKESGDRAFCEGMNKVVVHGASHNPAGTGYPGIVYGAGTHYNDKRVWWSKIKPFNDYLARISYIFQEADFVADVAFYYGDTIPNFGGPKNSRFTAGLGYDYVIFNTEKLLELEVKNQKLVLPSTGSEFKILALTDEYEIHPQVLLKLKKLADQGAVIIGKKPEKVATRRILPGMPDTKGLIEKLWTNNIPSQLPHSESRIYAGISASDAFKKLKVGPDFSYPGDEFYTLDYIHYAKDDLDFYFIRNTTGNTLSRNCQFRLQDRVPEIWDPVSGERVLASIYNVGESYIQIPLTLQPYESKFVVFKKGNAIEHFTSAVNQHHPPHLSFIKDGIIVWEEGNIEMEIDNRIKIFPNKLHKWELKGAWEVFFPEGWDAPEKVVFPELTSWTESEQEGIKYFSGTVKYRKTFFQDINDHSLKDSKIYLDLGDLSHVGEVWLNDEPLGITWAPPYRYDITEILKPGQNLLEVEVANTWSNRLVGDAVTDKTFTSTNRSNTVVPGLSATWFSWKEVPLIRSGLFGPVEIITIQPILVK